MSLEVDDVQASARDCSVLGITVQQDEPRAGLDSWRVMDLDPRDLFGINVQLVETND